MKKALQLLGCVIVISAFCVVSVPAQELGIPTWTRYAAHITTKTTTTPVAVTAVLHTVVINCSGAGTAWTITIQSKEDTPKILYVATLTVGTTTISLPVGIKMTSGIDIVTGGTTAGVADVWMTYR